MPSTLYVLVLCLANIGLSPFTIIPNRESLNPSFVAKITSGKDALGKEKEEDTVRFRDIVINELFVDPTGTSPPDPQVLPSKSSDEFIELFNSTSSAIDISGFDMAGGKIGPFILEAFSYVILTSNSNVSDFESFGNVVGVTSWNNLLNGGEKLVLRTSQGTVIDSVTYDSEWYGDAMKSNGAWTLEQINPYAICNNANNWSASIDVRGGSPGTQNSIFDDTPDLEPPGLTELEVISSQQIRLHFSEPMNLGSLIEDNLQVSNGLKIDSLVIENGFGTSILITLESQFESGIEHEITLSGLADCSGNAMEETRHPFFLAATPGFQELIITEIMADPSPTQGLPESEYLEIYNRSDLIFTTAGLTLSDKTGSTTLSERIIQPKEYLILTPSSQSVLFMEYGLVMGVSSWRSLNITSDIITISNGVDLIHEVSYSNTWYRSEEKAKGGFSLEMIDLNYPCYEMLNWNASTATLGGTPGSPNSVGGANPDLIGPSLICAFAKSANEVELVFSEKLAIDHISPSNFTITPALHVFELSVAPDKRTLYLQTNGLQENKVYRISADNIADCSGNLILSSDRDVQLIVPSQADSLDVVINEVLFDPLSGGVRFVELYNKSDRFLNLNGWALGGLNSPRSFLETNLILSPGSFQVITSDTTKLKDHYPNAISSTLLEAVTFPSLSSQEGPVVLKDSLGQIIDSIYYSRDYHSPLLSNNEGISLERIHPEEASINPNNWASASSQEHFATPGYLNSQFRLVQDISENFNISPKAFIPDQPGPNNFANIRYQFMNSGNLMSIGIYDTRGNLIKRIAENSLIGTTGFFRWDGDQEDGSQARVGYYLILFEVTSPDGKLSIHKASVAIGSRF